MGYYQEKDEAMYGFDEFERQYRDLKMQDQINSMSDRYYAAGRAQLGATINCSYCNRLIVKKHVLQKFCPPIKHGKKRRSPCKDKYHNYTNPRGKFAHLGD